MSSQEQHHIDSIIVVILSSVRFLFPLHLLHQRLLSLLCALECSFIFERMIKVETVVVVILAVVDVPAAVTVAVVFVVVAVVAVVVFVSVVLNVAVLQ